VTLARELVRTLRAGSQTTLPEEVALAARLHLHACGVDLCPARRSRSLACEGVAAGPAPVFSRPGAATDAALVNGGLIHSLEYDDTHTASIQHGSAVIAAAALAVGEARGASGAALLGAFARGWEVLIRFGLAAPARFHAHGFMSTSVGGALASALLASELLGSSEDQSVAALGISLSQASGA
jgi:2-methylcitrate dehydratase PrpD